MAAEQTPRPLRRIVRGARRRLGRTHPVSESVRLRHAYLAESKEHERAGDLTAAAADTQRAIDTGGSWATDRYRLGRLTLLTGDEARATAAYRAGLDLDPTAREIDYVMLEGTAKRFAGRRKVAHFVDDNLVAIQNAAAARHSRLEIPAASRHVFVYWAQGFTEAPPVVKMCLDQLTAIHAPGTVVPLDDTSLGEWVDLPAAIVAPASRQLTQYSDLVRTALLARHGGFWVDATTFVVEPLPPLFAELTPTGFFTFRYRPTRIASWVMAAEPGHHVVEMLLEALLLYWRTHTEVLTYFMFHDMLEAFCHLDPATALIVEASPYIRPSWQLQHRMAEPYDEAALRLILDRSFAHKLSYKKADTANHPGTMLSHLLQHGYRT